jgi:hypothetical protein
MTGIGPPEQPVRRPDRRFGSRWGRGLASGAGIGLGAGVVIGLIVGLIVFEPGGVGFWMAIVAASVFGVGLGTFIGGISRLESPTPGREPSEVGRPLRDESGFVKEEHPGRGPDRR